MSCEALNPFVLPRRSCVTSRAEEGVALAFQTETAAETRLIELHTLHLRPRPEEGWI